MSSTTPAGVGQGNGGSSSSGGSGGATAAQRAEEQLGAAVGQMRDAAQDLKFRATSSSSSQQPSSTSSSLLGASASSSSAGGVARSASGQRIIPGQLSDLIMWRNAYRTAAVFVLGNVFFFSTTVRKLSMMTVFANLTMTLVGLGAVVVQLSKLLARMTNSEPLVDTSAPSKQFISPELFQKHSHSVVEAINSLSETVRHAIYCKDLRLTAKVFGAAFLLRIAGRMFEAMKLGWMLFLLAFTAPKVYELKHEEIDAAMSKVRPMVEEKAKQAMSVGKEKARVLKQKMPPQVQQMADKVADTVATQTTHLSSTPARNSGGSGAGASASTSTASGITAAATEGKATNKTE